MRNRNRLEKLEARYTTNEMIVFIPAALDDSIPEGCTMKRVFSDGIMTDTILNEKEYLEEISSCDNLISIGEA